MNEDMDLNERDAKLDSLIEALQGLVQKIDEMDGRINEIDSVLYDGLIGPANDQIAQNEYDSALSDFRTKYSEKLEPFSAAVKAIEGDDEFDVTKEAFDMYNNGDYDFSPDEYVDKLSASLAEQIQRIKESVAEKEGVSPEDVKVEVDASDGEVQVDVDNTETEEKPEDNVSETVTETEVEEPSEEAEDGETLEDFEESLRKEAEKDKDHKWIRG